MFFPLNGYFIGFPFVTRSMCFFTVFIIITFRLVIEFVVEILLYFAKYEVEILICTICWNNGINHSSFNQVTI